MADCGCTWSRAAWTWTRRVPRRRLWRSVRPSLSFSREKERIGRLQPYLGNQFRRAGLAELVDGNPCLLIGIQGIRGGATRVPERIEVVDERDAAVIESKAGNRKHVGGLVQVMRAVTVGEDLRLHIRDPRLVDIGGDLIAGSSQGELRGVDGEARYLLVALVAIEEAQGDVD